VSLSSVIAKLCESGDSPRISKTEIRKQNSIRSTGLRENCESRESASLLHTRAGAHAHARAREEECGQRESSESGDSHAAPSLNVTLLKHGRCGDCLRSRAPAGSRLACSLPCLCRPPADEWHYCAEYHGPQISKDVWAWPRRRRAEVAAVSGAAAGPSGVLREAYRRENGSGAGFFRSAARVPGMEGHQP